MERKVIIRKAVSAQLGRSLPRESMLTVLVTLRQDLLAKVEAYRHRRDPEDPRYFIYRIVLSHQDPFWRALYFWVDDTTAADFLFVDTMADDHRRPES